MGGGTSSGTVLCCSARFKASLILLMASFRVLRLLRNYCDPFLPKDDSSSAEGLRLFLSCLRRCESPAGPSDPARRAQIDARLHARHSAELASPDGRKH